MYKLVSKKQEIKISNANIFNNINGIYKCQRDKNPIALVCYLHTYK